MKKRVIAVILILSMVLTMGSGLVKEKKAEAMGQILGNSNGFLLADQNNSAKIYVDTLREEVSYGDGHEYCGLKIIADTFAEDVGLVTGNSANVVTSTSEMSGNVIIAGTVGHNDVIDTLAAKGVIDISGLYKNGELKWDCYQMQFVDGSILSGLGYQGINRALVITGSNKKEGLCTDCLTYQSILGYQHGYTWLMLYHSSIRLYTLMKAFWSLIIMACILQRNRRLNTEVFL